jgi:hypothetical protein
MTAREQLIAYLATLAALVIVITVALLIAAWVPEVMGKMEVFGLGTVTGGLIGVLRIPSVRTTLPGDPPTPVTVSNPASDPVPVASAE